MPYKLIENFKKIINSDPVFSVRAAVSPLFMVVTWQEKIHPLSVFCITKERDSRIAVNDKEYIAIATDRFREYFKEKISIQELQDEYRSWESDTQELYNEITDTNLNNLSDEELRECMLKINNLFLELARRTIYIENVDYEKILSVIGLEYKEKLDAIWERATEGAFISFDARRLKKMLDLVSSNASNIARKAKFMFTDYFWTKSEYEISEELNEIKDNFSEKLNEFEQIQKQVQNRKKEHDEWVRTLDKNSGHIAAYAQLVMHMRDLRKDPIAQLQAMSAEVAVVMLERSGIDTKFAPFVLLYEYMKGTQHLSAIKEDVEQRDKGCIFIANPDLSYGTERCDFESAVNQFTQIIEPRNEKMDLIKGQVACRGKVTGTVRVVFDPHDDKGFQQNDILVTSMTRPEFVPVMKKAAAVITDEGGITCHAAIVSRELNIPCVIGTKIATQLLKDGDIVEVDAEKGVVKILNNG